LPSGTLSVAPGICPAIVQDGARSAHAALRAERAHAALRAERVIRQKSTTVDRPGGRVVVPGWCGAGLLLVAATVRGVSAEGVLVDLRAAACRGATGAGRSSISDRRQGFESPAGPGDPQGVTRRPVFDVS